MNTQGKQVTLILAEDEPGHAKLTEKNLRRAGFINPIQWCDNGRKTLDFILGSGDFEGQPHITNVVLLLDLNMPIVDGYQVLEHIKSNPATRHIPIIILTTTGDSREVRRCYNLGCNIYITKPVDYVEFSQAIKELGLFLSVITLPNGNE